MAGPKAAIVDRVGVLVIPDVSKFLPDLRKYLARVERSIKIEVPVGADDTALERAIQQPRRPAPVDVPLAPDADGFLRQAQRDVKKALASIELDVPLTADGERLRREVSSRVAALNAQISQMAVEVPIDAGEAAAARAKIRAEVESLQAMVKADPVEVPVKADVDQVSVSRAFADIKSSALDSASGVQTLLAALALVGPAAAPIAAVGVGATAALGPAALAAFGGVGVATAALSGVKGAIDAQIKAQDAAAAGAENAGELAEQARAEMAKLTPAAQEFANFLIDLRGPLGDLQREAAEGFLPGLLDGLKSGMQNLSPLRGLVGDIATEMGDLARAAGDGLGNSAWQDFFAVFRENAADDIGSMGRTFGSLATGMAAVATSLRPIVDLILPGIEGVADAFERWATGGGMQGVVDYIIRNGPTVWSVVKSLSDILGNFLVTVATWGETVLPYFDRFLNWVQTLPGWVPAVVTGLALIAGPLFSVGSAVVGVLAALGPVGAVVAVALAAVALFAGALWTLYQRHEGVRTAAGQLMSAFQGMWAVVQPIISQLWSALVARAPEVKQTFREMGDAVAQAFSTMATIVQRIGQGLKIFWDRWGADITAAVSGAFSGMLQMIRGVAGMLQGAAQMVQGVLNGDWSQVWQGVRRVVAGAFEFNGGLLKSLGSVLGLALKMVGQFVVDANGAFLGLMLRMPQIGVNIVRGLIDGLQWAAGWGVGAIADICRQMIDAAKSALGINSPSREFAAIGRGIPEGLRLGVDDESSTAVSAADRLASSMIAGFGSPKLDAIAAGGVAGGGAPGGMPSAAAVLDAIERGSAAGVARGMTSRETTSAIRRRSGL